MTGTPRLVKEMKRNSLYRQLTYLGENFDFTQPEDYWARDEYNQIKKTLGLDKIRK